jgi:RNA polymerase sigma-70 factor (ECF subfamily)
MGEAELNQLIAGCLKQDRKHQKMLYKAFYGFAMGVCLRYAGNRYEAAEIMNQGFMKVFTHLNNYDSGKPFIAWVGRIMMNTSVDYYRSNLKWALNGNIDEAEDIGHTDLPDRKIHYDDLIAMIQQLPNAYRTVFNLYAIEGFTHEEIAEQLNINIGTSKSNLFKAREKLKIMLKAEYISGSAPSDNQRNIVSISAAYVSISFLINMIIK